MDGTQPILLNMMMRWVLAVLAIAYSSPLIAADGACYDARLPFSDSQRKGCRVHQVILRDAAISTPAKLVQVIVGSRMYGDYGEPIYHYYLFKKNAEIEAIGEFSPWENVVAAIRLESILGFQGHLRRHVGFRAGPVGPTQYSALHDTIVERDGASFCLVREFRPPFVGRMRDCIGKRSEPEGQATVGYATGTLRVDQAWRVACEQAVFGTTRRCMTNDVSEVFVRPERVDNDILQYLVVLRREATPAEYLVYEVNAHTSAVRFVELSKDIRDINNRYLH